MIVHKYTSVILVGWTVVLLVYKHNFWLEAELPAMEGTDKRTKDVRVTVVRGTDVRGTNVKGTYVRGTDVSGTDVRGTDIKGAGVSRTDVNSSKISGTSRIQNEVRGTDTIRHCSQQHRLSSIQRYCWERQIPIAYMYKYQPEKMIALQKSINSRQLESASASALDTDFPFLDYLDDIPDAEILRLSHELWMDPVNKVIVCMHDKAGSSTWKAILGNNTISDSLKLQTERDIHWAVFSTAIKRADDGNNVTQIRHRLRHWYKIAVVRHPFDRSVSYISFFITHIPTIIIFGL